MPAVQQTSQSPAAVPFQPANTDLVRKVANLLDDPEVQADPFLRYLVSMAFEHVWSAEQDDS